jgi:hypothetical protein
VPGAEPPFWPIYNLSPRELKALEEFIHDRLEKGHIRESMSPAGAAVIFAPKKDGTLRLCVDYQGLNAITIKNHYPIPLISELLDWLQGAKIFSKLDLLDAYYWIQIKDGDEWKTAFQTCYGHYEFLVMPMGLTNAPVTFQSYINNALWGYVDDFCVVYLDNILVYSQSEEEYIQHLEKVMEHLCQSKLYANPKKCSFFQDEIEFLGYLVNADGVRMDPKRIEAIQEWKNHPPRTFRDIQVFLGFCNFYRRFIHQFLQIVKPILQLLHRMKKGQKPGLIGQDWQEPQQQALEELINWFTTAPILWHYDPSLPLRLEADACYAALAGVLSQHYEDGWHPIAFYSQKFTPTEWHYPIYDKEMMAIVMSFGHWHHYLDGASGVKVFSDHQNLRSFMSQTRLNGRQTHWLIKLLPYDFQIFYQKGALNPADGPSRRPDYLVDAEEVDQMPVSQLLPALSVRIAHGESWEQSSRPQVGMSPCMTRSPTTGKNFPNHLPALTAEVIADGLPTALSEEASVEGSGQPTEGIPEEPLAKGVSIGAGSLHPTSAGSEIGTADAATAKDIGILCLQLVTRAQAKMATKELIPGEELPESLLELIRMHQEQDPYCKQIARQALHPCWQPNLSLAISSPMRDNYTVQNSTLGGMSDLLCVACHVIVPEQASLHIELLRQFYDCPTVGH